MFSYTDVSDIVRDMGQYEFLNRGDLTYLKGKHKEIRVQELVHRVFQHYRWSREVKWWNPLTWLRCVFLDSNRLERASGAAHAYARSYLAAHVPTDDGIRGHFLKATPRAPYLGEFIFSLMPSEMCDFSIDPTTGAFTFKFSEPKSAVIDKMGPKGWKDLMDAEIHVDPVVSGTIDYHQKVFTFEGLRGEKLISLLGMNKQVNLSLKKLRLVERKNGTYDLIVTVSSGINLSKKLSTQKFIDTFKYVSWG